MRDILKTLNIRDYVIIFFMVAYLLLSAYGLFASHLKCDWTEQTLPVQKIKHYIVKIDGGEDYISEPEFNENGDARLWFDLDGLLPDEGEIKFEVKAINILDKEGPTATWWLVVGPPKAPTGLRVE